MSAAYLDLGELFDGLFPPECRSRLVLMIRGYVDSSVSGDPPIISVAGFVGPLAQWRYINRKWRDGRAQAGLESFRMASFMSTRPVRPYCDWTPTKKQAVITRLINLIVTLAKVQGFGVSASFPLRDYEALPEADREVSGNNPFALCAMHMIGMTIKVLEDNGITEPVAYVFDAGDDGQPRFIEAMTEVIKHFAEFSDKLHILSVVPVLKSNVPAIDTADFLAWQSAQHAQLIDGPGLVQPKTYLRRVVSQVYVANRFLSGSELMWDKDFTPFQRRLLALLFGGRVRE